MNIPGSYPISSAQLITATAGYHIHREKLHLNPTRRGRLHSNYATLINTESRPFSELTQAMK